MSKELEEYRRNCEASLKEYAVWCLPNRYFGDLHFDMFDFIQYGDTDSKLILVPRDHQKAQVLSDKVLTPTGYKLFSEVQVGDEVLGVDGGTQTVVGLNPIYDMPVYEVQLDDGRVITVNDEHLFDVECPSNWGKGNIRTKPLKWIKERYKSERFDKRNGNYYSEFRFFVHPTKPIEGESKDLSIDPYVLGCWLGDGNSRSGIITSADDELFIHFPYKVTKHKAKYNYGIEGLTSLLKGEGLLQNKHIPSHYLQGSKEQREALLQGLMDTDGFAHKENSHLSYTTILPQLKDDVVNLVRSLGGKAKVHDAWTSPSKEDDRKFHSYTINIWLPEEIKPFRLARKLDRVKPMRTKSAIVDIRYKGIEKARCIQVSNPDGLYLSNDYFVTHNSICIAVACSWFITVDPSVTINYISYNSDLVHKQLDFIKNILRSERHRTLWPNLLNWVEDRGELKHKPKGIWQQEKFKVDHPAAQNSADPTVRAGTVRGTNTGMHSKVNIFDDLVTDENWKTEVDKAQTLACYENFSKILSPGGKTYAVGTRYSPDDLYSHLKEEEAVWIDPETREEKREVLWEVFERVIEDSFNRDGTGNYAWPRMQMDDGSAYGFDARERAIKFEKLSKSGLANAYAQYYNDPNDDSTANLKRSDFQYLDPRFLTNSNGIWYYRDEPLKVYAYADLAFTDSSAKNARRRDFTAIAVTGIDTEGNIYVLDLKRFQTDKNNVYFDEIIDLHEYWGFKSITVETNSAGKFVKKYLEDEVRRQGGNLIVEGKPHVSHEGTKAERIQHTLMPRYKNNTIWHSKGGYTKLLEDELVMARPPHDDLKDALAGAVNLCVAPVRFARAKKKNSGNIIQMSRFGGSRRNRRR